MLSHTSVPTARTVSRAAGLLCIVTCESEYETRAPSLLIAARSALDGRWVRWMGIRISPSPGLLLPLLLLVGACGPLVPGGFGSHATPDGSIIAYPPKHGVRGHFTTTEHTCWKLRQPRGECIDSSNHSVRTLQCGHQHIMPVLELDAPVCTCGSGAVSVHQQTLRSTTCPGTQPATTSHPYVRREDGRVGHGHRGQRPLATWAQRGAAAGLTTILRRLWRGPKPPNAPRLLILTHALHVA